MKPGIELHALSDPGTVKDFNQDFHGYLEGSTFDLFVVADGVGSRIDSDLAAGITVNAICDHFAGAGESFSPLRELELAMMKANDQVRYASQGMPEEERMASTAAVLLLYRGEAWTANAGDSRVYLFRDQNVYRISHDHSTVQEKLDRGIFRKRDVPRHPGEHNRITRAIGLRQDVIPEIRGPLEIGENDIFIVCSDGLTEVFNDSALNHYANRVPANELAQYLITESLNAGAQDNITVMVVKISEWKGVERGKKLKIRTHGGVIRDNLIYYAAAGIFIIAAILVFLFVSHKIIFK